MSVDLKPADITALVVAARDDERADVLAFLRKRRNAAETVARRYPEDAERGRIIAQQIGAEIEMIEQGLHVGDAACEAALQQSEAEREAADVRRGEEIHAEIAVWESNAFNEDVGPAA